MNYLRIMDLAASGLRAGRIRMNVIAQNIANAEATRTEEGGPYRRKLVLLGQEGGAGTSPPFLRKSQGLIHQPGAVAVVGVIADPSPFPRIYNPSHPDADADGWVEMPNVELPLEMVDLLTAVEAYEANAAMLEILGKAIGETINLLR